MLDFYELRAQPLQPPQMKDRSKSPERHSRHSRSRLKASMPIAIPPRRKSPPENHSHSPDMIFDMSPISPTFSPTSSLFPSTSRPKSDELRSPEHFMYNIPIFRNPPDGAASHLRQQIARQNDILLRNDSVDSLRTGPEFVNPRNGERSTSHASDAAQTVVSQQEHLRNRKTHATTKITITGFVPINEHQPPIHEKPPRPTIPLHPPPRTTSYASSSRAPIDKGEDEVSYSQADPSLFEFQRHLLRRIENQDPSRFKRPSTQCF